MFSGTEADELGLVTELAADPVAAALAFARELATAFPRPARRGQAPLQRHLDGLAAAYLRPRARRAAPPAAAARTPRPPARPPSTGPPRSSDPARGASDVPLGWGAWLPLHSGTPRPHRRRAARRRRPGSRLHPGRHRPEGVHARGPARPQGAQHLPEHRHRRLPGRVRKFNELAAGLEDTTVLNVSVDLPFALTASAPPRASRASRSARPSAPRSATTTASA